MPSPEDGAGHLAGDAARGLAIDRGDLIAGQDSRPLRRAALDRRQHHQPATAGVGRDQQPNPLKLAVVLDAEVLELAWAHKARVRVPRGAQHGVDLAVRRLHVVGLCVLGGPAQRFRQLPFPPLAEPVIESPYVVTRNDGPRLDQSFLGLEDLRVLACWKPEDGRLLRWLLLLLGERGTTERRVQRERCPDARGRQHGDHPPAHQGREVVPQLGHLASRASSCGDGNPTRTRHRKGAFLLPSGGTCTPRRERSRSRRKGRKLCCRGSHGQTKRSRSDAVGVEVS